MNHKVWLIVFGVISLLLVGGAGFYAFSTYGDYSDALAGWDSKVSTIGRLEKQVPYPNEENTEALEEKVEEYRDSVEALSDTLNTFQRPLNETLASTEFQQKVKTNVQEFREYAKSNGVEFGGDTEFQLGFDKYSRNIPPEDLVPVLDYELEAIDHLVRELVDAGADTLISFERDPIPGESGAGDSHESSVVHKYPIRLRFRGEHSAFQDFINTIANDKDFFYVVRVLKVENDVTEGPPKLTAVDGNQDLPQFEDPQTKQVASYEMLIEWGYDPENPEASTAQLEQTAKEAGFIPSKQDARVLMGQEKLNVFMVVDIVRFVSPDEQAESGESGSQPEKDR